MTASKLVITQEHIDLGRKLTGRHAVQIISRLGKLVKGGQRAIYKAAGVDRSNHHYWDQEHTRIQLDTWLKIFTGIDALGYTLVVKKTFRRYTFTLTQKEQ